ncbi:DUF5680 domain-containing protein [Peteryoungia ipomoeae]|uniref:DUF5680 domain-containing protein n=1 Tax=Peteryoungia ipomoeae TaxID=1210932 RepID=A0A4S8NUX0_9HYPH|nr:DUF5680 domain-containing protein [Peteryoungia ipomoeae]THV21393.1 hypothetical protein FAA97_15360 [Peteryoungia ipomoeae]
MKSLEQFIVEAKGGTYMAGKTAAEIPSRLGAKDIAYENGQYRYLDSYYGGTDFVGQEAIWHKGTPVWAMNYYGRIVDATRFDGEKAGIVIKQALLALYQEKRFLGGFAYRHPLGEYIDETAGDYRSFTGIERILVDGALAYRLDYHGGLIIP